MVECQLPKLNVAGSIPVSRSRYPGCISVYILHSAELKRFYVGIARNPLHRLKQHLQGRAEGFDDVYPVRRNRRITVISGVVPIRIGGPQVPVPGDV